MTTDEKRTDDIEGTEPPSIVRRSDMGLAVSGTRISLYLIMDYLRDDWPHEEILKWLPITREQLWAALDYIDEHREEVEAEFAEVLRQDEEQRLYYEEELRKHLANVPPAPADPAKAAIYKKLADERVKLRREIWQERERECRTSCADCVAEILVYLERYHGTPRLFVP